jgi:hypothetical protein
MSSPKAEVLCNDDLRSMIVSFANTKCGKCINCRRRIQATRDNWRHIKACEASTDDDFHQYHRQIKESCYSPDLTRRHSAVLDRIGVVINGQEWLASPEPPRNPYVRQTRNYDSDDVGRMYRNLINCSVQ